MAKVYPNNWNHTDYIDNDSSLRYELPTLQFLATHLSDDYNIYHSVHWNVIKDKNPFYGEIDFVVVNNKNGNILLIEQKSGHLEETANGLVKSYGKKRKNVQTQIDRSRHQFEEKIKDFLYKNKLDAKNLLIEYLLYCPDYTVKNFGGIGIDYQRIVDKSKRNDFDKIIVNLLNNTKHHSGHLISAESVKQIHKFLSNILDLEVDVSLLINQTENYIIRISGGLSEWVKKLDFNPYRLHVIGTAGSGKSQLSYSEFLNATEQNLNALYVCYNRPLADHMQQILLQNTQSNNENLITTFHNLCIEILKLNGVSNFDFKDKNFYDNLLTQTANLIHSNNKILPKFDTIIIDEGQDFEPEWLAIIFELINKNNANNKIFYLEDPLQNLYKKSQFINNVNGNKFITLKVEENYRSPQKVIKLLQNLTGINIKSKSPFEGNEIEIFTYKDNDFTDLIDKNKQALNFCIQQQGFKHKEITLLSFQGRKKSHLINLDRIGDFNLNSFTGNYDDKGNPIHNVSVDNVNKDNNIIFDTVYRFKGKSSPAVILTEIDFYKYNDDIMKRLFVGATRATMSLILVMSEQAANIFMQKLS